MLEFFYKIIMRLVFPNLVREMKLEGNFSLDASNPVASLEEADIIRVEDNQADVTIFVFTGLDVLYAGHSKHHMMGVLKRLARKLGGANLVFLRDPQRLAFLLRPDGQPGGIDFYESVVRQTMARLGAAHNVAIGSSVGGAVAHGLAYRCGMQQVITFSALFKADHYVHPSNILRSLFNLRGFFKDPRGYLEILMVTLSTSWIHRSITKRAGYDGVEDPITTFRKIEQPPFVTLFYGEFAPPDAAQAMLMHGLPNVKLVPLPTSGHNTPGYLYKQRALGKAIGDEIAAVLRLPEEKAASTA